MSFWFVVVLLSALIGVFADQLWRFQHERATGAIDDWAREQRVAVVASERRLLATGPFPPWTAADQPVYRLTVRTSAGERHAWLQCGELPWGVLSPAVAVHWESPKAEDVARL